MKVFFVSALATALLYAYPAFAAEYRVDPAHSSVGFKVAHLGISRVSGRFTEFLGTFSFDPEDPSAAKAEGKVIVKSITTEQSKRDDHLRSPDFFNAQTFPEIGFRLTSVQPLGGSKYKAQGDFTMHGVTKPISLTVDYGGSAVDPSGTQRAAFTAATKINRKDFGLTWSKVLETGALVVGEDVDIVLEIEGVAEAK